MNSGTKDGPLEERMRVHTNGNVGIGVMDPKTALHIPASGLQIGNSSTATDNFHWTSDTLNGPRALRLYNGNYGQATRNLLTVTSDGNVGIGIGEPRRRLDVAGEIVATSTMALAQDLSTSKKTWYLQNLDGRFRIFEQPNISTPGIERLAITQNGNITLNGNVGIGTDNPYTKLHIVTSTSKDSPWDSVYGNPWLFGQHIELAATQMWGLKDAYGSLFTWDSDSLFMGLKNEGVDRKDAVIAWGDNSNDVLRFIFTPASAPLEVMRIAADGNVSITGNVTCKNCPQSSDARYKDNIENLSGALDKVLRLRGVSFRWRDEPSKPEQGKQFGLIGQEVSEILPEAVFQDDRGFLSIAYSVITSVMVEAMKEQQAHMNRIEDKISEQQVHMDRMEDKISELQGLIRDLTKSVHT
jgi:hypothetical protein